MPVIALVAVAAAVLAALGAGMAAQHPQRSALPFALASAVVTIGVLLWLGRWLGGSSLAGAVELGSGVIPVAATMLVPALPLGRVLTLLCAVLAVPVGLWIPLATAARFGVEGPSVQDFGGALGLVIGPSVAIAVAGTRPKAGSTVPRPARRAIGAALALLGSLLWLTASENAIDQYTGQILLGALAGLLGGSAGWVAGRFLRHGARPSQDVLVGLGVGGAVALGSVTLLDPAVIAVAAVLAGAITGAARGARDRPAIAFATGAAVGLLAIGVASSPYGFIDNARVDVLEAQLLAILLMSALGAVCGLVTRIRRRSPERISGSD